MSLIHATRYQHQLLEWHDEDDLGKPGDVFNDNHEPFRSESTEHQFGTEQEFIDAREKDGCTEDTGNGVWGDPGCCHTVNYATGEREEVKWVRHR